MARRSRRFARQSIVLSPDKEREADAIRRLAGYGEPINGPGGQSWWMASGFRFFERLPVGVLIDVADAPGIDPFYLLPVTATVAGPRKTYRNGRVSTGKWGVPPPATPRMVVQFAGNITPALDLLIVDVLRIDRDYETNGVLIQLAPVMATLPQRGDIFWIMKAP